MRNTIKFTAVFGLVLICTVALVFGMIAMQQPDAGQQLLEIAIPYDREAGKGKRYETVNVNISVRLPDGTTPKRYAFALNAPLIVQLPSNSWFSKPSAGFIGNSNAGGSRMGNEPMEREVPVGANVVVVAGTISDYSAPRGFSEGANFSAGGGHMTFGTANTPLKTDPNQEFYVARPFSFVPEKENDEIVLQLEKATLVTGTLRYANGEPATGEGIAAKQFVPATRGADIPSVREHSAVSVIASTDEDGNFVLPLWDGEFTLFAGGTQWSEHVTKTIRVEQDEPLKVDLTIPTPLRVNVVMPDGSPAGNFRLSQLMLYRPVWRDNTANFPPEASFRIIYSSRSEFDAIVHKSEHGDAELPFIKPENPIVMHLTPDGNYVAVMTEDNEFGIVRKLEPELMGQELTLTLRPTIAGTVKLIDELNQPVVGQGVSIPIRLMNRERGGNYAEQSGYFGPRLWFYTDADGRLDFKIPVFEGIDDAVSFHFRSDGRDWDVHPILSETHRGGNSWFGGSRNGIRFSRFGEWLTHFRPPADGEAFDLGVMAMER